MSPVEEARRASLPRSSSSRTTGRHHSPCVPILQVSHSLQQVRKTEAVWRSLSREAVAPFQTYGWNLAWYQEFEGEYDEILVFVVSVGDEVKAILPCYRKGRDVRFAGDKICDYQDVIALNLEDAVLGFDMASRWIRQEAKGCSLIMEKASSEGWVHNILNSKAVNLEPQLHFSRFFAPSPVAETSGSLEGYLATLPRKVRQDFRRSLNRLERETPESSVKILRSDEIGEKEIAELSDFHDQHFRKGGESPCRDDRLQKMLLSVASDREIGFQLAILYGDSGRIMAVDFGFARGGRYFGYLTAFDMQYRKLAPGKCLLLRRLDSWAEEDGVSSIDFLSGDEGYKQGYTQGNQYEVHAHWIMPLSLENRFRFLYLHAREGAKHCRDYFRQRMAQRRSFQRPRSN